MKTIKPVAVRSVCHAALVCVAAGLLAIPALAAPIPVRSVQTDADGVTFTMSPGKMKLTVCSDRIVRVMYSPISSLPAGQDFAVTNHSWPATSFKVDDSRARLTITTRELKVAVDKATGAVAFSDASGHRLLAEPAGGGKLMPPRR